MKSLNFWGALLSIVPFYYVFVFPFIMGGGKIRVGPNLRVDWVSPLLDFFFLGLIVGLCLAEKCLCFFCDLDAAEYVCNLLQDHHESIAQPLHNLLLWWLRLLYDSHDHLQPATSVCVINHNMLRFVLQPILRFESAVFKLNLIFDIDKSQHLAIVKVGAKFLPGLSHNARMIIHDYLHLKTS